VLVEHKPRHALRFSVDNVTDKRCWAAAFDNSPPDLLQGAQRTFKLSG
jgi:iron complex outermembrane receptor protein